VSEEDLRLTPYLLIPSETRCESCGKFVRAPFVYNGLCVRCFAEHLTQLSLQELRRAMGKLGPEGRP